MKRLNAMFMLCVMSMLAGAQTAPAPERAPGYAPLQGFVGHWTTQGREQLFRETCDWYHGKFHVVCHSESKRADGSIAHGMSILSFVPATGYVYTGIGSRGRYETFEKGRWEDGKFVFDSAATKDGKPITNRISIGPFTDAGFQFVVTTSSDGVNWTEAARTRYVRLP